MQASKVRSRFDTLRSRVLAARYAFDREDIALRCQYGQVPPRAWLTAAQRRKLERAEAAVHKTFDAMFAHVAEISPRDWSNGVPVRWVCEELTYDDAVRPLGSPLSVDPPLSYGTRREDRKGL